MRQSLSIAAALLIAATGTAFAHGGANSDRGDTNPYVPGATQQVQVATSSQTAELTAAGAHAESLR